MHQWLEVVYLMPCIDDHLFTSEAQTLVCFEDRLLGKQDLVVCHRSSPLPCDDEKQSSRHYFQSSVDDNQSIGDSISIGFRTFPS